METENEVGYCTNWKELSLHNMCNLSRAILYEINIYIDYYHISIDYYFISIDYLCILQYFTSLQVMDILWVSPSASLVEKGRGSVLVIYRDP